MLVVVVVAMTVLPWSKSTLTPLIPGSPASWQPLALRSFQTKSPIVIGGGAAWAVTDVPAVMEPAWLVVANPPYVYVW